MYCRNCGKELPHNSNFCPECGAKQNDVVMDDRVRARRFFSEHKYLFYGYAVWLLAHLTLLINSTKHNSEGFYPWNRPLNNMVTYFFGGLPDYKYECSWLDKHNVYDFSEFFLFSFIAYFYICP